MSVEYLMIFVEYAVVSKEHTIMLVENSWNVVECAIVGAEQTTGIVLSSFFLCSFHFQVRKKWLSGLTGLGGKTT